MDGLSILYASQDCEEIETGAPTVARLVYPDRIVGRVIWHGPTDAPDWSLTHNPALVWSEVVIEDRGPRTISRAPGGPRRIDA